MPWALPPCPASWHSCSRRPGLLAPSEVAEQQDGAAAASMTAEAPPPSTTHPHRATGQRSVAASQHILLGSWPLQPCAPYSNYPSEPPLPFPGLPAVHNGFILHGWAGHSHPKPSVLRRVPGPQGPGYSQASWASSSCHASLSHAGPLPGNPPIGACQLKDTSWPKTSSMSSPGQLTPTPAYT